MWVNQKLYSSFLLVSVRFIQFTVSSRRDFHISIIFDAAKCVSTQNWRDAMLCDILILFNSILFYFNHRKVDSINDLICFPWNFQTEACVHIRCQHDVRGPGCVTAWLAVSMITSKQKAKKIIWHKCDNDWIWKLCFQITGFESG